MSEEGLRAPAGGAGHEATMQGTHFLRLRTADGFRRAIDEFNDAIALDASYAPAYAGLSRTYALAVTYRYKVGVDDAYEAAGRALWYAERAVELDPFLADAWAARGYIQMLARAPLALARADFDQAGALEENNDNALAWKARVLTAEGNDLDALLAVRQARDIAPGNAGRRVGVALHAFRLGRYVEAISEAFSAYDLQSELMLARAFEARALLLSGGSEECLGLSLGPHAVIHAMCLHAQGRVDEARAIVDSVAALALQGDGACERRADDRHTAPFELIHLELAAKAILSRNRRFDRLAFRCCCHRLTPSDQACKTAQSADAIVAAL